MRLYNSGSEPRDRELPGVHGKISRGAWMAVEFSCIAVF